MSLTDDVKPGEARCPGHPTTKELIKGDKGGAPKALLEESYEFIGDEDIPYERYTSQEFAKKEDDRMCRGFGNGHVVKNTSLKQAIIMYMM